MNNQNFITHNLITYIGNKRKLISFVDKEICILIKKINTKHLKLLDGFSGGGCISRLFKSYADILYVNDLENYCKTLNSCYLANKSEIKNNDIIDMIDFLNNNKLKNQPIGFIEDNYAPNNDNDIQEKERVFYTRTNAKIIDNIRRLLEKFDIKIRHFGLAPLIVKASIHTNTSGVFKGFHKKDGIGHFGGKGENALFRIKKEIFLEYPLLSNRECEVKISQGDTNKIVTQISNLDIAYYDPPYNQHPYGSNYFMLNIINNYNKPKIQENGVSGIIENWNKSNWNTKKHAESTLEYLIKKTDSKYIVISYNNEGIISIDKFKQILEKYGKVELKEQEYNTYKGSKNLKNRSLKVKELLWILNKA